MSRTSLAMCGLLPLDDPYPGLERLRERAAVHRLPELGAYLVVSHALAAEVLHGSGWSSDPLLSPSLARRFQGSAGNGLVAKSLLFSDPPGHARLRKALSGWLTPRAVESSRPRIAAIARAALAGHDAGEPLEVMENLAYAVPLAVICELLDAPAEVAVRLREETPRMAALLDPLADADAQQAGAVAAASLLLELVPLVAERRDRPGPDLLSALANGSGASQLEADEAVMMTLLLLVAGHETTANLIGNAVAALHAHPGTARYLRHCPDRLPAAVEELLRYDSPVQLASRIAARDMVLGQTAVRRGEHVLVGLGAANRDPAAFPDASRLDISRPPRPHLAFGHGPHFCAGAALARAEAQEALRHLLNLTPPIEGRDLTLVRGRSATFRRITTLRLH